jgi:hypothetical protein
MLARPSLERTRDTNISARDGNRRATRRHALHVRVLDNAATRARRTPRAASSKIVVKSHGLGMHLCRSQTTAASLWHRTPARASY